MPKKSVAQLPIEVEIGGQLHRGRYSIHGKVITVSGPDGLSKSTQLGGTPAHTLARMLLRELVRESRGK